MPEPVCVMVLFALMQVHVLNAYVNASLTITESFVNKKKISVINCSATLMASAFMACIPYNVIAMISFSYHIVPAAQMGTKILIILVF